MKKIISRIENWLLIIPGIFTLVEVMFFGDSTFDLHLHDTYFVVAHFYIGIAFFVLNLIPFSCHLLIRIKRKGNKKILFMHVLVTNLLLTCFFILSNTKLIQSKKDYDFSSWKAYRQFENLSSALILAFLIIQLLFILYTVVKLLNKKSN